MPERVHMERRLEDDRGIQRFTIITLILIAILIDGKLDFELFGKESTPHCHTTFVKRAFGRYYYFFSFLSRWNQRRRDGTRASRWRSAWEGRRSKRSPQR